jgi:hypothetical protein
MLQLDEADFGFVPEQRTLKPRRSGVHSISEKPSELEYILYMVCPSCSDLVQYSNLNCSTCGAPLHGKAS